MEGGSKGCSPQDPQEMPGMAVPWSYSAEAFLLHQLGTVSQFWKQGRQAKFTFEVKDGEGFLNLSYRLPGAAEPIPPNPHPKFPNSKVPKPTKPTTPLFPGNQGLGNSRPQAKSRTRSPSYYHRNYLRAVLHRAAKSAQDPLPPLENDMSLKELASSVLRKMELENQKRGLKVADDESQTDNKEQRLEASLGRGGVEERGDIEGKGKESQPIIDRNKMMDLSEGKIRKHKIG